MQKTSKFVDDTVRSRGRIARTLNRGRGGVATRGR